MVIQNVPLLPPAANQETAAQNSLKQMLKGLRTVVQAVREMRNRYSDAHGHEAALPEMGTDQALLVASATDAIIGFLYSVHASGRMTSDRSHYGNNEEFNNYVDQTHENGTITILESEFRPSEVLFEMEPETYRLQLAEFRTDGESSREVGP